MININDILLEVGYHKDIKDEMRIRDILLKANGSEAKAIQLATNMAKAITDKSKALRRGQAASDLAKIMHGQTILLNTISNIFFKRAGELGGSYQRTASATRPSKPISHVDLPNDLHGMFRKIALMIHPDKARSEKSIATRNKMMADLNLANRTKNATAMRRIYSDWQKLPAELRENRLDVFSILQESMKEWARKELQLAGYKLDEWTEDGANDEIDGYIPMPTGLAEDAESDPMDQYVDLIAKSALELVDKFSDQGHSGMSAPITLAMFTKLANYEPLSPITSKPEDSKDVSEYDPNGPKLWQNVRDFKMFSNDGGNTWYSVEDGKEEHLDEEGFPYVTYGKGKRQFYNDQGPIQEGIQIAKLLYYGRKPRMLNEDYKLPMKKVKRTFSWPTKLGANMTYNIYDGKDPSMKNALVRNVKGNELFSVIDKVQTDDVTKVYRRDYLKHPKLGAWELF